MRVSALIRCLLCGVFLTLSAAWGKRSSLRDVSGSYGLSEEEMTEKYGFDPEFWKTFSGSLAYHETVTGVPYGVMSSTVDFDMIQVCLWLPRKHDDAALGTFLTQLHFQSLSLGTVRVVLDHDVGDVSLAASNLTRLGISYGELFRELCGASNGFLLMDAGLRVPVHRVSNSLGSFYVAQMSREDVCDHLRRSGERLKAKYDVSMLRLVCRFYLKRFLTNELTRHPMSASHLRQTFVDLYLGGGRTTGGGILARRPQGTLCELEALRLLAYSSWLGRWAELRQEEAGLRESLRARLPDARKSLRQVWPRIPVSWRGILSRALVRLGEREVGVAVGQ